MPEITITDPDDRHLTIPVRFTRRPYDGWDVRRADNGRHLGWVRVERRRGYPRTWSGYIAPWAFVGAGIDATTPTSAEWTDFDAVPPDLYGGDPRGSQLPVVVGEATRRDAGRAVLYRLAERRAPALGYGRHPRVRVAGRLGQGPVPTPRAPITDTSTCAWCGIRVGRTARDGHWWHLDSHGGRDAAGSYWCDLTGVDHATPATIHYGAPVLCDWRCVEVYQAAHAGDAPRCSLDHRGSSDCEVPELHAWGGVLARHQAPRLCAWRPETGDEVCDEPRLPGQPWCAHHADARLGLDPREYWLRTAWRLSGDREALASLPCEEAGEVMRRALEWTARLWASPPIVVVQMLDRVAANHARGECRAGA